MSGPGQVLAIRNGTIGGGGTVDGNLVLGYDPNAGPPPASAPVLRPGPADGIGTLTVTQSMDIFSDAAVSRFRVGPGGQTSKLVLSGIGYANLRGTVEFVQAAGVQPAPVNHVLIDAFDDADDLIRLEFANNGPHQLGDNKYRVEYQRGKGTLNQVVLTPVPKVKVKAFRDVDEDGVWDAGEPGWGGLPVHLSQGGLSVGSGTTDAAGEAAFDDLALGTYAVAVDAPPGTTVTAGAASQEVTLAAGSPVAELVVALAAPAPVGVDDVWDVPHHATTGLSPLSNDYHPLGEPLVGIELVSGPSHGSINVSPAGHVEYIPAPGYAGPVTFTYRPRDAHRAGNLSTVTLNVLNQSPMTSPDWAGYLHAGESVEVDVLANDSDPDGDPLAIADPDGYTQPWSAAGPAGSVVYLGGGRFRYTAPQVIAGFLLPATFSYTVSDGYGGTATAEVSIDVQNSPPDAPDATASVHAGQSVSITPGIYDIDVGYDDDPTVTIVSGPAHGTVTYDAATKTFVYTHTGGTPGVTDSFTYLADDGHGGTDTGTVQVFVTNTAPTAAPHAVWFPYPTQSVTLTLGPDTDSDGDAVTYTVAPPPYGSVSLSGSTLTVYAPTDGSSGEYTFSYTATDAWGATATEWVTITVDPPM